MNPYLEYMRAASQPMRTELTNANFTELVTPEEVEMFFNQSSGTSLVVINSVCGCAAGLARPAAIQSLEYEKGPDNLVTVFAGQDREATEQFRSHFPDTPASSPSIAILKDGKLMHFIPREFIENEELENIIKSLTDQYEEICS